MTPVLWGIVGWVAGLTVVSVAIYMRGRKLERRLADERAKRAEWCDWQQGDPLTVYEEIQWEWPL